MSTNDYAETLKQRFWQASIDFWKATGDETAPAHAKYLQAEADLLQALRVPPPESEDFLSVRDSFAMAALNSIINREGVNISTGANLVHDNGIDAVRAYGYADAMMLARKVAP